MKLSASALALLGILALFPLGSVAQQESWADRVNVSGDLRLRYEDIEVEGLPSRDRARYRARIALAAALNDKLDLVMELASNADDPVSRNVTFDGGFSADDIGFDLAYVDWQPAEGLHVLGGKMKNPLYRAGGNSLLWDGDLNPEGIALTYGKGIFFGNLGRFWVEERAAQDNSTLSAVQVGAKFNIGESLKLTAGVGYFAFSDTIGNEPFYNGLPKGNSVDALGNYIYEYKDTEIFLQLDTRIGELPLQFFVHSARNGEVDDQDTGVAYGAKIGNAADAGDWEAALAYHDVETDVTIGTFNDSDFRGGGTGAAGLIIKGKYALSKNVALAGTYFANEIRIPNIPVVDYDRLQLDVEFKFK